MVDAGMRHSRGSGLPRHTERQTLELELRHALRDVGHEQYSHKLLLGSGKNPSPSLGRIVISDSSVDNVRSPWHVYSLGTKFLCLMVGL